MPGDRQLVLADRRDARQADGGERPARLAGLQVVAVLPGDDQVFGVPVGVCLQGSRRTGLEPAPAGQVAPVAGQVRPACPHTVKITTVLAKVFGPVSPGGTPGHLP